MVGETVPVANNRTLQLRQLGDVAYQDAWQAMSAFTDRRGAQSDDEIWLLEHPPVYTQGQAGKAEHILNPGNIPVIQVDRGGQVTYHGPGQLVAYLLIDLKRLKIGVRQLVDSIENAIIRTLAQNGVAAFAKTDAPGVYVRLQSGVEAKIASLGLRVRKGCSFHGLSLNLDCDLSPFAGINPCGYAGMAVTRLADLVPPPLDKAAVARRLVDELCADLGYNQRQLLHTLPTLDVTDV